MGKAGPPTLKSSELCPQRDMNILKNMLSVIFHLSEHFIAICERFHERQSCLRELRIFDKPYGNTCIQPMNILVQFMQYINKLRISMDIFTTIQKLEARKTGLCGNFCPEYSLVLL
jgi:hypothetical protein